MKLFRFFSLTILLSIYFISSSLSAQLINLADEQKFYEFLGKEPIVVEFFATWCGVCTRAKPMVEQLAHKHSEINFVLIDGDKFPNLRKKYRANAFPTFVFIDATGSEIDRITGRDEKRMEQAINKISKKKEMTTTEEPKPIKTIDRPKPITEPTSEKKVGVAERNVIDLSSMQELETIRAKGKPMMYDFYTVWCSPCKQMKPMIENELSKEYSDVIFVTIDAEKFPKLEAQYQIKGYPTFIFHDKSGKEITRLSGGCDKMLMQGKLNQISGKKSNLIIMDEKEMQAKTQAEGNMMPKSKTQKAMPVETKPMKTQQPAKEKKVSSRTKRNGRR